jgi:hypothetical protein
MLHFILLLLVLLYFFTSLIYFLYKTNNNYYKAKYNNLYDNKFKGGKCPSKCKKGICYGGLKCKDYFPYNEECCNFDFECNHCDDTSDNKVYKEYETREFNNVNELVSTQNEYINDLNDKNTLINQQQ